MKKLITRTVIATSLTLATCAFSYPGLQLCSRNFSKPINVVCNNIQGRFPVPVSTHTKSCTPVLPWYAIKNIFGTQNKQPMTCYFYKGAVAPQDKIGQANITIDMSKNTAKVTAPSSSYPVSISPGVNGYYSNIIVTVFNK